MGGGREYFFDAANVQSSLYLKGRWKSWILYYVTHLSGSLVNHIYHLSHSVLELIIEEQVEKLQVTLRGIETLSVVARDTASKLTELIGAEEVHVCMCAYVSFEKIMSQ